MQVPGKSAPKDYLALWSRAVLGLVFVWAACSKFADLPTFVAGAEAYRLPVSPEIVRAAAGLLPVIELACGLCLITGFWSRQVLSVVAVLLVLFLGVLGQALARGLPITCSCFSLALLSMPDPYTNLAKLFDSIEFALARDVVLLGFTSFLLVRSWRRRAEFGGGRRREEGISGSDR